MQMTNAQWWEEFPKCMSSDWQASQHERTRAPMFGFSCTSGTLAVFRRLIGNNLRAKYWFGNISFHELGWRVFLSRIEIAEEGCFLRHSSSCISAHKRVFLHRIKPDAKPIALIAIKCHLHARPLYWTSYHSTQMFVDYATSFRFDAWPMRGRNVFAELIFKPL